MAKYKKYSPKWQQQKLYNRWVKQIDMNHYDYKIGVCIDYDYAFTSRFVVTSANVHDDYVWAD